MKTVILVCAGALLVSTPAWACRGTVEYPEVQAKLAMADLPDGVRKDYSDELEQGMALHMLGHQGGDRLLRMKSLKILDDISHKLGM